MKRLLLLLTLVIPSFLFAKVVYVNTNYTGTVQNGESWATPYTELKQAVDAAEDGDELWFSEGVYNHYTNDVEEIILIDKSLSFYGGFEGSENSLLTRDYRSNITEFTSENGAGQYDELMFIDSTALEYQLVLDGITFTKLNMALIQIGSETANAKIDLTVKNSIFQENFNNGFIYLYNKANVLFDNIIYKDNSAYLFAGSNSGPDNFSILNSVF